MIGNRFYTWFKNYYQWVGGAFNETLLLPLVRATAGLRAGAIRYDETTNTVETYDGTNWNAIPSASGFVPNSRTITINGTTFDLSTNRIYSVGTVTSVGLSMPAAFTVSGSPVTGAGTLSVTGAGLATQYVRGDGTLANFPTTQGGGSSVSYYLNGSINQGTFAGSTYYEMNRTPVLGAGTNFSRNTDGYIASFITDANDPALTEIPGGNFNLELYFSASSGGGNPSFYVELYKYDGTNFSLIASNSTSPDSIVGATKDAYFTAIAVPQTTLAITDRLAIRVYVNTSGRTITLHTEDQNLCQVITTFSTGINTINGLTKQVQFLTTGTNGTDFNINSTNSTHTFNIPTASATNRGALSSADWTTFNNKVSTSRQLTINGTAFDLSADRSWNVGTVTSVGLDTGSAGTDINVSGSPVNVSGNITLNIPTASATNRGALSAADWAIFNAKQNALTLTTTGNSGASTLVGATLNVPEYTISGLGGVPTSRTLTINGTAFDLSANRSWSVGTVTSVGLTSSTSGVTITDSPVTVSGSIGIAIATANGSQQGLLSSTDWTTFNNKQNTLSLTTTGTSGAATLIGATLNVPQYQAQGNYITSLTGEATASGPGAASVTLSTTAVTGKLLTGLNLSGGGTIAATDSILTAFGKVQNQISAMVGGVMYQGTWNASTNTPTLTSSVGVKGYYYIVDVSGTTSLNGISDWRVGDWAIFNGSTWDKVDNTDAVSSVNGFTGAVSLTTSHIAEGTNLYYLDSRSRTAISLTTTGNSGAATYSSVSGIINVPQYTLSGLGGVPSTRQLTINGTAFDLSADRVWNVGNVTGTGANGQVSFWTGTGTQSGNAGFIWDNANNRLAINRASASSPLDIQGTTATDGGQLGSELLTSANWTTTGWTGDFTTGFTNSAGNTTALSNSFAAVIGTAYQITYTITGRTAGSVTIALGGQSIASVTATGAFGPIATTTGNLVITPTSDFNGTIVISLRAISNGSATMVLRNSAGTITNEIRSLASNTNTFVGLSAGSRLTSGVNNTFYGSNAGQNNTTGSANTFIGRTSGVNNTTGQSNVFIGSTAGSSNTIGSTNVFIGQGSGESNTSGNDNTFIGRTSGVFNTTGSSNVFLGLDAGRRISGGGNLTIANNSVFVGRDTRANADSQTNQIVIGNSAIGLGSNTTVIGNTSTVTSAIYGNLLLGTTADNGARLQVNGITSLQGTTATDGGQLGSELLTSSGWTTTGWTGDFTTGFTNGSGNTTALSNSFAAVIGTAYQIAYTITGRTAGSVTIALGGQSNAGVTATGAFGPTATTTGNLTITPTSDFNGTIVISLRVIANGSATVVLRNSAGTITNEIRNYTANSNIAIGVNAGRRITTGVSNIFIGLSSGQVLTTGAGNTFVGAFTGINNTTGRDNSFFGRDAGQNNITGGNNTFVGATAGFSNTTGIENTFVGSNSGFANTTGLQNTFIGVSAGAATTTGNNNTFIGRAAGFANTTGEANTIVGRNAGLANTTGTSNSFFGMQAGQLNTTGATNSFFGRDAGLVNTTGSQNSFFGHAAGFSNTTAGNNSFFGFQAGVLNTTGGDNTFIGRSAGQNNTTGGNNVFLGFDAGRFISGGGNLTIANNSVFVGRDTRANADSQTNQIVIGNSAIGLGSNTTVIGNSSTTHGRWFGSLLVGTSTDVASSILTLDSTTRGFLPPRMTSAQRNAISTPAEGLVVYNTTDKNIDVYDGTRWLDMPNGLKASATLDFGSTAAQSSSDLTITVTGAAVGDIVDLGVPNASVNANTCYTAWVSATDTVTVRFNNYSSGAVDPASGTFRVYVIKN